MPKINMTSVPRYMVNNNTHQPWAAVAWFYNYDDAIYFAQNQSTDYQWLSYAIWDTHTGTRQRVFREKF